jgi:hypothetical protein
MGLASSALTSESQRLVFFKRWAVYRRWESAQSDRSKAKTGINAYPHEGSSSVNGGKAAPARPTFVPSMIEIADKLLAFNRVACPIGFSHIQNREFHH